MLKVEGIFMCYIASLQLSYVFHIYSAYDINPKVVMSLNSTIPSEHIKCIIGQMLVLILFGPCNPNSSDKTNCNPGLLVVVSLMFCTPYFYYIPKASLAAVIIAAVVFMVEVRVVKPIYRTKSELLLCLN